MSNVNVFIDKYFHAFNEIFGVSKEELINLYEEDYYPGFEQIKGSSPSVNEMKTFYCSIRLSKPKKILEVGNFRGHGSNHILLAAENNGFGEIHLVDIIENLNYENLHSNNFTRHVCDSLEYLSTPFDFDFIVQDGCHTYEHVKKELEIIRKNATSDFVIWSHDYFTPSHGGRVGVKKAWDEEKEHFDKWFALTDGGGLSGCVLASFKR